MRWFRSRHGDAAARDDADRDNADAPRIAAEPPAETPGKPVISHVAGLKADIRITLPDGGKSRLAHYGRLGNPSLGRVRVGARNLALRHEPRANDAACAIGEIAAEGGLAAFTGAAMEGQPTDWHIPLADGEATVRILLTREEVPA